MSIFISIYGGKDFQTNNIVSHDVAMWQASIRYCGKELGKTMAAHYSNGNPTWNYRCERNLKFDLCRKEIDNKRPFFFEYISIDIWDFSGKNPEKVGEARVYLAGVNTVQWYRVLFGSHISHDSHSSISVGITIEDPQLLKDIELYKRIELSQLYSPSIQCYKHLFINLDDSLCTEDILGLKGLPCPSSGEYILDKYDTVDYKILGSSNAFGDRYYITCSGSLIITDLRVLFIPNQVNCPAWIEGTMFNSVFDGVDESNLSQSQVLLLKKMTFQLPLGAVYDCKVNVMSDKSASLIFESKDGASTEFIVKTIKKDNEESLIEQDLYVNGLATDSIPAFVWASRVSEQLLWLIKEDRIWIKWLKCLKQSCEASPRTRESWFKRAIEPINLDSDYQRVLRRQKNLWQMSALNTNFQVCQTYPSTLVFPSNLSNEDILACAAERSKRRLSALVWLHPYLKTPLCRAAQPKAGATGTGIEMDKKACLAIKNSCPTGKPLRIADARPKLSAQANAVQGKGFENTNFLGGPSVATIGFFDIENIHVVRSSLSKLREGYSNLSSAIGESSDALSSSKWLNHVSSVLKGSVTVAESLMIGHPVLVHCSDGWDRTAQLASIAQLLLDPHYRTIDGFFQLINKEWIYFGHMFEERVGNPNHKDFSPVFLQFLDATFQILQQFPTSFEFSANVLTVLSQAAYSGYFTSFRCKCERERNLMMNSAISAENLDISDMNYSSVFAYISILMRTESTAHSFVNPFYQPPLAAYRNLQYIKPRTAVADLQIWKEGLGGYNQGLSPFSPNIQECMASQISIFKKTAFYSKLHKHELSQYTQNQLDIILSDDYEANVPVLPYDLHITNRMPPSNRTYNYDVSGKLILTEKAAIKLQLWYKSLFYSMKAIRSIVKSYNNGVDLVALLKTYQILAISEFKTEFTHKYLLQQKREGLVRFIVDDIIEDAVMKGMQSEEIDWTRVSTCSGMEERISESYINKRTKIMLKESIKDMKVGIKDLKAGLKDGIKTTYNVFASSASSAVTAPPQPPYESSSLNSTSSIIAPKTPVTKNIIPGSEFHYSRTKDKGLKGRLANMFKNSF